MRYTIFGAGAIGGAVGAHLIRSGQDVLIVESDVAKIDAIRRDGLIVTGKESYTIPAEIVGPGELRSALGGRSPECVILAVKSQHTGQALSAVGPLMDDASFIVSMQNGLNPYALAETYGSDRIVGAFLNTMGAYSTEPGRIVFGGPARVYLGELSGAPSPRVEELARLLRDGFAKVVTVTDNIIGNLWGKAAYGNIFFVSAIADETMATITGDPENRALMTNLVAEVMSVADAEGARCDGFDGFDPNIMRFSEQRDWPAIHDSWRSVSETTSRSTKPKSGIWIDLAVRGTETEVDYMLGIVDEIGMRHGIQLPLLRMLVDMVHAAEKNEISLELQNLYKLREACRKIYENKLDQQFVHKI
ncbi:MAG: 2-dehydropantoate 2-reductase [Microvirga sp.]|nr:2-dehydropantoate 2-reductase [Microvirga sp.]